MNKLIKITISFSVIFLLQFFVLGCSPKTKNITFGNMSVDIPVNFKSNFLQVPRNIMDIVDIYESYGLETKEAIFSVIYTKYKKDYLDKLSLKEAVNGMINNLKSNVALRDFSIVSEDFVEDMNAYIVVCSFYYGPNKTLNKAFLSLNDGLLQIMCMYNENSNQSQKEIDKIISSVKVKN